MLTYPHPPSLTAVHSTNRIMPCGCILRSWPARPKWAPMTVPFLGYTAHDGESTLKEILSMYNSKSDLALPPRLLQFCSPPRLQVNRGTYRFGRYKNPRRPHPPPRASRVSHHPPQVSGLTLAHPCSPTLTHRRPLDQSTPAARVHFWPLVSAAAMGSHGRVVSGLQRIGW
jgi:hypothetical protein